MNIVFIPVSVWCFICFIYLPSCLKTLALSVSISGKAEDGIAARARKFFLLSFDGSYLTTVASLMTVTLLQ